MGLSVPITILTSAGDQLLISGGGRIVFVSVMETSQANVASFRLFDGEVTTDNGLLDYSLNAAGSARDYFPEHGIPFRGDLWIGDTIGTARLICHVVPENNWDLFRREYWREFHAMIMEGVTG